MVCFSAVPRTQLQVAGVSWILVELLSLCGSLSDVFMSFTQFIKNCVCVCVCC